MDKMKIDIIDIIEKRQGILKDKIEGLEKLKSDLVIIDPIEFSVSEIRNTEAANKHLGFRQLNELVDVKGPVVYFIEIVDLGIKAELLSNIEFFRSKENVDKNGNDLRRATCNVPKDNVNNTAEILYVGSVEKGLLRRVKSHLGYGSATNYSLQLRYWANDEWRFRFYYFKVSNKNILKDIEAQFSKELNPLLGKREK